MISYGFTTKAMPSPIGPRLLRITDIQNGEVVRESVPYCAMAVNGKGGFSVLTMPQ